ncbi:unnamed protein product [Caenorhabditis bovis]|uniref:Uncharacterized protein n=1 Tax=Caenorhabditis bovis TaxID=2654633 RepID=A0A8S1EY17_9PELO|nr:unnamed protein product [Caenorhabditis bovis]
MSFAKSYYAEQKPVEERGEFASAAAIPATTPVADEPLSPAQIQEAIRLYRSVISNSTPSSPARPSRASVERKTVHSNYYGGGPQDVPQSYMVDYRVNQNIARTPIQEQPKPAFNEKQLISQLQNLAVQQDSIPQPVVAQPTNQLPQVTVISKKPIAARKMYEDDESGYCFNKTKNGENEYEEEQQPQAVTPKVEHYYQQPTVPVANYTQNFQSSPQRYSKTAPSEYLGMSNENRFIYDGQSTLPAYNTNNYTLVNAQPQVVQQAPVETEEHGVTTTEDETQRPVESPVGQSRFRGLIKNAGITQCEQTAPIVVERVADQPYIAHQYQYDAFHPVLNVPTESEYQLPVLNDLASCIENY